MEERSPSWWRRLGSSALLVTAAVVLPIAAVAPLGDVSLVSTAVLSAAFGLVLSLRAGWERAMLSLPVILAATTAAGLTGGTPPWVVTIAAVGALVGVAARAGWAVPLVVTGFLAASVPAIGPGSSLAARLLVIVLGVGYAAVVARALGAPRRLPGTRLPWSHALVAGAACAVATGAGAWVALVSRDALGYWLPATVFLLILPSADLNLTARAVQRSLGALVGALAAVGISWLEPAPWLALVCVVAGLLLAFTYLTPLWLNGALFTAALMLLLSGSRSTIEVSQTRVAATVVAGAVVLVVAAAVTRLARHAPDGPRDLAADVAKG